MIPYLSPLYLNYQIEAERINAGFHRLAHFMAERSVPLVSFSRPIRVRYVMAYWLTKTHFFAHELLEPEERS